MKTRQSTKLTKSTTQGGDVNHGKASVSSASDANQKVSALEDKAGAPPRRSPRFVSPIGHAKDSTVKTKND